MPQSVCISFPAFSSGNFSRAYAKSSLNLWCTAKIWHPAWWKAEDWMLMIKHRVTWHHVSPQNKKTPKAYQHLGSFPCMRRNFFHYQQKNIGTATPIVCVPQFASHTGPGYASLWNWSGHLNMPAGRLEWWRPVPVGLPPFYLFTPPLSRMQ